MDTLTPLDARNSLLLDRKQTALSDTSDSFSLSKTGAMNEKLSPLDTKSDPERYVGFAVTSAPEQKTHSAARNLSVGSNGAFRPLTPGTPQPTDNLVANAAPFGRVDAGMRQPTLPNLGGGYSSGGPMYNGPPQQPRAGGGYGQMGGGGYNAGGYGGFGGGGGYRAPGGY